MLLALKGLLKFGGRFILNKSAEPVAISIYPLKSKYNWNAKLNVTNQLPKRLICSLESKPPSTMTERLSAIKTFLINPIEITIKPIQIFL